MCACKTQGLSHTDVGLVFNCTSSQISKWMKLRFSQELWENSPDAHKPQRAESRAKFKVAETELYDRFLHRRKSQGLFVDGLWLRKEMRQILETLRPRGYLKFRCSNGWLYRFCSRWNITSQAKTDGKTETAESRKAKIVGCIADYMRLQRSKPPTDSRFGRFSPSQHWSTD